MCDFVIRFPRPIAIAFLLASLPVFFLLTLGAAWMTLSMHLIAERFPFWMLVAGYILFPAMTVFGCACVHWFFLYGRETLFTSFRFTEQGLAIENARYPSRMLLWSDIESASYSSSLKTVVLRSPKLPVPIAISQWTNFPDAVQLLQQKLGTRWLEKWI